MSLRQEIYDDVAELFNVDLDDIPISFTYRERGADTYNPGGSVTPAFTNHIVDGVLDQLALRQRDTDTILEDEFIVYMEAASLTFTPKQDDKAIISVPSLYIDGEYRVIEVSTDPVEAHYVVRFKR